MAWRCTGSSNAELISNLFTAGLITSPLVRSAMSAVDRAHFCPLSPSAAYEDSPQPIGHSATISAPHMHAAAAESLLPLIVPQSQAEALAANTTADNTSTGAEGSHGTGNSSTGTIKVLDIGSGSGYLTTVLAHLVGPSGRVIGIEHIDALAAMGKENLARSATGRAMLDSGRVEFVVGDGRKGYAPEAPYDAIHVGAAAKELHPELVEQLKSPGRLFIPVEDDNGSGWGNQWIWVVDKDEKGHVKKKRDMGVRYVPLTDRPK